MPSYWGSWGDVIHFDSYVDGQGEWHICRCRLCIEHPNEFDALVEPGRVDLSDEKLAAAAHVDRKLDK